MSATTVDKIINKLDTLPNTRITPVEPQVIVAPAEVSRLLVLAGSRRQQEKLDREEQAHQHKLDFDRFKAEYESQYPNRATDEKGRVRGAKNIRKELAIAFPGVKFKITSESFANGNSIHISWTDGPTVERVNGITGKYQEGTFDGMQDLYVSNRDARSEALHTVLGSAKYVQESRSFSEPVRDAVAKIIRDEHNVAANAGVNPMVDGEPLDRKVSRVLRDTNVPLGKRVIGVRFDNGSMVILFED